VINLFIWTAESYLDITEKHIQPLYGYPLALSSFALPLEIMSKTFFPLLLCPILYYKDILSRENSILLVFYIISTAPYLKVSIPVLVIVVLIYLYTVKEFTGLEDNIATAPAGTLSFILTYIVVLAVF